jgi:hypothetical protein
MQSILRVLNIVLSPVLTLFFASKFTGITIAGRDAGDAMAGTAAGLVVLAVELALTQGPKHSVWLRRWLDPRAAFEGGWIQNVTAGQGGNAIGIFWLDYQSEKDTFAVRGYAYSANFQRWAKWVSTHMFIDTVGLTATYRWDGQILNGPTPEREKTGLTKLELRWPPPVFAQPLTGGGEVSHVGEGTYVTFDLYRITNRLLTELGLPFTLRQLRINAHDEEAKVVEAFLTKRHHRPPAQTVQA